MPELAWANVVDGLLTGREQAPRSKGLTMVIDKGLGISATSDLLEICGGLIDHWKCTFGTSAFVPTDVLRRKLMYLTSHGALTYPGGTLLEVFDVPSTTASRRSPKLVRKTLRSSQRRLNWQSRRCRTSSGVPPM